MLLSSVSMIELEARRGTKNQRTQAFHILVPFSSFLGVRNIIFASSAKKRLFFDRTTCILAFIQVVI